MFNTYSEILTYIDKNKDLTMLGSFLSGIVAEEATYLYQMEKKKKKLKEASQVEDLRRCTSEAEEHYTEEINYFIEHEFEPTAMTIMGYRRKPNAWAVAQAIKEYISENN